MGINVQSSCTFTSTSKESYTRGEAMKNVCVDPCRESWGKIDFPSFTGIIYNIWANTNGMVTIPPLLCISICLVVLNLSIIFILIWWCISKRQNNLFSFYFFCNVCVSKGKELVWLSKQAQSWDLRQWFPMPFLLQLLYACFLAFYNISCSTLRSTWRSSIMFMGNLFEFSMKSCKKEYSLSTEGGCMHMYLRSSGYMEP